MGSNRQGHATRGRNMLMSGHIKLQYWLGLDEGGEKRKVRKKKPPAERHLQFGGALLTAPQETNAPPINPYDFGQLGLPSPAVH